MSPSRECACAILFDCGQLLPVEALSALADAGFQVRSGAGKGASAMEELCPDIVVVGMPPSTGVDGVRSVRQTFRRTPMVLIGSADGIDTYKVAVSAGAVAVLGPLCSAEALAGTLRAALSETSHYARIHDANRELFALRDRSQLAETVVRVAMRVMEADAATLFFVGVDGKLYIAHAYGIPEELRGSIRIAMGEGIAGRVALSGKPAIINGNPSNKTGYSDVRGTGRPHSSVVYPLMSSGQLDGLLTFNRIQNPRRYTGEDLELASIFAAQVLVAMENARLLEQNAQSEKLASLGPLAHGVAHEINTPAQCISDSIFFLRETHETLRGLLDLYGQLAQVAVAGAVPTDALEELSIYRATADIGDIMAEVPGALDRADRAVARVRDIVKTLKAFAESGTARELVDLNQLVETTLAVASAEYAQGVSVSRELGELPFVYCCPGEINQAILGLVKNAAQAAASVGDRTELGRIHVQTSTEGAWAVVRIVDNGMGIAPEVRGRVFDPFFTTREVGQGRGMGLTIARTIIVAKHRGELAFDTELGRGTCFTMRLPVRGASLVTGIDRPSERERHTSERSDDRWPGGEGPLQPPGEDAASDEGWLSNPSAMGGGESAGRPASQGSLNREQR